MIKKNSIHVVLVLLSLYVIIFIIIGTKGCINRSANQTKSGSSDVSTFIINAPSNLTATVVSYSQINLSWQDNSNNEDGLEIERSTNPTAGYVLLATVGINVSSYSDNGPFILFAVYYYRVRAMNTIGDRSGWSNEAIASAVRPEWGAITAGESHSFALNTNGSLWGWGRNSEGQLNPSNNDTSFMLPTLLNPDTDWLAIAAGYYHTLAIKTNSTLWTWGDNSYGQLGLGDTEFYTVPTLVRTDSDWVIVCGGEYHTIALKSNATLWSWGDNTYDQLGLGDPAIIPSVSTPTQIGTTSDWLSITSGGRHNIALKTDLTLWAWGWNLLGQLGSPYIVNPAIPNKIGSDSDWSKISAGYIHTIALKITGSLWQWGTDEGIDTPIQIGTDTDWSDIWAGGSAEEPIIFYHSLAFKSNGTLWAWGINTYGQLGLNDNSDRTNPTQIGINYNWAAVAAGGYHSIGRTADGVLWVWGRNELAQLGLGNTEDKNIPINLDLPQPTNLIATVITYTQITLFWADNSSNETGFIIESRPASAGDSAYTQIATVGPNIISYPDETVTHGNTYYYRVKASYSGTDSTYSNVAVGVTRLWENKINQILTRRYHSMVWDGQKVIMFGGYDGAYKNDLWWYEPISNTWTQKFTSITPTARIAHSMVWDNVGQRVIMFGGYDSSYNCTNDLWWYEPALNTWIVKTPASSPPSRQNHSMVWDNVGQRAVMFGGTDTSGNKNDLWWYEPALNIWTEIKAQGAPGSPSARYAHAMVWDGQKVIMFGGEDGVYQNDLWWWW